jgi:hypothetical protein
MFIEINDCLAAHAKLADRYADIKAEIEGLKLLLEEIKVEIVKTGRDKIVGTRNTVTVTLSEPVRFNAAAAKELLTAEQIAACTEIGELVTTLRVKAVKAPVFA